MSRDRSGSSDASADEESNVLAFSTARSGAGNPRLAELLETAKRLQDERASAASVVTLIDATPADRWPLLAADPRLQTNAALERLGDEVRRRMDRNPREALSLAELATTIADSLPAATYPAVTMAQIRAMAWKDRANALRFLGRYAETFEAIARAEEILEKHVALGLDRAVVDLVKALTLGDTGEYEAARTIAMTCGSVFLAHGDLKRALYAGEIEAYALYEEHRYPEANALYNTLIDVARGIEDEEAEARLHGNAAYCALYLGDYRTANIQFSEAIAKLTDRGEHVAATRTRYGAGLVLIGKGQIESGLEYVRAARAAFTSFDLLEESALCGLSIAEVFIARGDRDEACAIVEDIARRFDGAEFERRVINAIAELKQAILDSDAPIDAVRDVYALIESVRTEHSQHA